MGDSLLQRKVIELFLQQRAAIERELIAAAACSSEAFLGALHKLKNDAHFVASDRILEVVASLQAQALATPELRGRAAEGLLAELDEVEEALSRVLPGLSSMEPR